MGYFISFKLTASVHGPKLNQDGFFKTNTCAEIAYQIFLCDIDLHCAAFVTQIQADYINGAKAKKKILCYLVYDYVFS